MQVPQYVDVRQPLAEFVAAHRKEIDDVIHKLATQPPKYTRKFPISDELREHIVISNRGWRLYAVWRKTSKPRRVS